MSDDTCKWLTDCGASSHMTPQEREFLLRKLALVMVGLLRQWELELPVHFIEYKPKCSKFIPLEYGEPTM